MTAAIRPISWRQAWTLARRDLNARLRGLRLLFICLLLGVGTLAAIGSLTTSITAELAARGQVLLGGDIEVAVSQRQATEQELTQLRALGPTSATIRMRAMAQRPAGTAEANAPAAILSELKGADGAYPLYGRLTLKDGSVPPALQADTILVGQSLVDRLALSVGDDLRFGNATYRIVGIIGEEPDRVGEGFTLGPVALTSIEGVLRSGLVQPGSLYTSKYRVRLPTGTDAAEQADTLKKAMATAGVEIKNRDRAAPGANRFFERMGQFLGLIGLTALVIAGIGVSNGVSSYLNGKRSGIATFKVLGARSGDIMRIYLLQVAAIAGVAIVSGLMIGALLPPAIVALLGNVLPVQPGLALHPLPLAVAAAYGVLITLAFTLPPLARARTQPAAAIFRATVESRWAIDRRTLAGVVASVTGILAIALLTAREPFFSAMVLASVAAVLGLLFLLGWGVRWTAQRIPRPRKPLLRLAIANLYRPGSQTPALVIALGLALTLFVTLAAIQTSLNREIAQTVPATAPTQFVLDVPSSEQAAFQSAVMRQAPDAKIEMVPALRGTIIAFNETRVADLAEIPEGAWFLRGERGVTYAESLPPGSEIIDGEWWPKDYAGPPLVSLDQEAAELLDLKVGDKLIVSVLGREIEAQIASLRRVNWDTMGFNYILVFSPNTLASAPHTFAATISMDPAKEGAVSRALLSQFPSVSIIAVGEVLTQVTGLLEQMSSAILAAASITILAGIAVLIGAIAASRQSRAYDSVIMKTLGATRWQVLGAQLIEYALLAAILASVALALGGLAAWYVITGVFDFQWSPDWLVVLSTLAGGAVITLGIGLAGSIPLMSVRPAEALRSL
jgi:putative ABC transport system permease protein